MGTMNCLASFPGSTPQLFFTPCKKSRTARDNSRAEAWEQGYELLCPRGISTKYFSWLSTKDTLLNLYAICCWSPGLPHDAGSPPPHQIHLSEDHSWTKRETSAAGEDLGKIIERVSTVQLTCMEDLVYGFGIVK